LWNVKNLQIELKNKLEAVRNILAQYSYIDNAHEWTQLLDMATTLAIESNNIDKEIAELERNSFCVPWIVYFFFVYRHSRGYQQWNITLLIFLFQKKGCLFLAQVTNIVLVDLL
jgi:hypothetical protein